MGDAASLFLGVCKGEKIRRRGSKEEGVVAPRENGKPLLATLVDFQEAKMRRSIGGCTGTQYD